MRRWMGLAAAVVLLLLASGALAQSAPDISPNPLRALMLGLALMTLTIVGSLMLFMVGGGDDRRHYHR